MTLSPRQDVTAVIINYGSRKDCAELAKSLEHEVCQIIVVDNSSEIVHDDPAFRHTRVITPAANIGFGAAANLAARQCQTRWLLVMNPDVRLLPNCIIHMLDAAEQVHAPLCGPRFYWDDACTFQLPPALGHPLWLFSDRHMPDKNLAETTDVSTLAIARHKRFWSEQTPFSEPVLSGACLFFDHHWFTQNDMPLFDEDFFLYYEDTDLCGRLMRKGVMPICAPQAYAVHYWNQSSEPPEGKATLMSASETIFLRKYYPDGAPPMPPGKPAPEIISLGHIDATLTLDLPAGTRHLDFGVQDNFIVFARTDIEQDVFMFSADLWQRITPGTYYFRAVDADNSTLACWQWQKQASVI